MNEQSILVGIVFLVFVAAMLGTTCHAQTPANDANRSEQAPATFVNSLGMKMIFVKARPFDAWTPSFADYYKAAKEVSGTLERPPVPHPVTLPADYYLAEFPVTNGMYRQFVSETNHREPGGELLDMDRVKVGWDVKAWSTDGFTADDQSVAGLNYMDAVAFYQWLSKKEGRRDRGRRRRQPDG